MLEQIYTEIVTEHSRSGHNRRHLVAPTATQRGINPSCGDEIELELRVIDGIIADAAFTGIGCAISQASASIMIDLIKGKSPAQALRLAQTFFAMIKREITDETPLQEMEDAVALRDIAHMPARVKCAVLCWHTLVAALAGQEGG